MAMNSQDEPRIATNSHDDFQDDIRQSKPETHDEIDEQLAAIADFFDGLQTGVSVMVTRLEPEWCSGYLEEKEIIEGQEPIDINYLIKTWGGKRLRCRVRSKRGGNRGQWLRSIDIPLQTWDPLRRGQRIYPRETAEESETWTTQRPIVQEQKKSGLGDLGELMTLMASMRQSELATLQALGVGRPAAPPRANGDSQVSVALELAKTFAQLQRPPATEEGAGLELFGRALDLLKPQPPLPAPAIVSTGHRVAAPPLAEQLSQLPPGEAVGCLQDALRRMPSDRQEATMRVLLQGLRSTGMLDGDDEDDEDDEDDPDDDAQSSGDSTPD